MDDPVIHIFGQEPSMSSKYPPSWTLFLTHFLWIYQHKTCRVLSLDLIRSSMTSEMTMSSKSLVRNPQSPPSTPLLALPRPEHSTPSPVNLFYAVKTIVQCHAPLNCIESAFIHFTTSLQNQENSTFPVPVTLIWDECTLINLLVRPHTPHPIPSEPSGHLPHKIVEQNQGGQWCLL